MSWELFKSILETYDNLKQSISIIVPLVMTPEQELALGDSLGLDRVKNHNHMSGDYIGPAHNRCNLNYKQTKKIPIFFHNLQNYDGHLIIQHLGNYKQNSKISCIANVMETYISFSIDDLVFLDSYNFQKDSLEKLAV